MAKFKNLVCALDITSDARNKALLLHCGGEEIYESFSDDKKGTGGATDDGQNEYNVLKRSFTDYFTPKKNTSINKSNSRI